MLCSITGIMDNPAILLNPEIQRRGAEAVKAKNREIAAIIGINRAARCTAVKPAGCLLPSTAVKTNRGPMTIEQIFKLNGSGSVIDTAKTTNLQDIWIPVENTMDVSVINENGENENISKLYINGMSEVYDVQLSDGTTVTGTASHKFKLKDGSWRSIGELLDSADVDLYK